VEQHTAMLLKPATPPDENEAVIKKLVKEIK